MRDDKPLLRFVVSRVKQAVYQTERVPEFGGIENLFVLSSRSRTKVFDDAVVNAIQLVGSDEFLL